MPRASSQQFSRRGLGKRLRNWRARKVSVSAAVPCGFDPVRRLGEKLRDETRVQRMAGFVGNHERPQRRPISARSPIRSSALWRLNSSGKRKLAFEKAVVRSARWRFRASRRGSGPWRADRSISAVNVKVRAEASLPSERSRDPRTISVSCWPISGCGKSM